MARLVGTAVGAVKEEARDAHLGGRKAKGDIGLREREHRGVIDGVDLDRDDVAARVLPNGRNILRVRAELITLVRENNVGLEGVLGVSFGCSGVG